MATYPRDLIPILRRKEQSRKRRRSGDPSGLPSKYVLEKLLDVAYQASFMTEEGRRLGFRIIYYSPEDHQRESEPGRGFYLENRPRLLPLDTTRLYTAAEVNRLAPAAELTRLMICVTNASQDPKDHDLRIWSLLDVGQNW